MLAADTSSSHSFWHVVYYVVRITVFLCEAQTSCSFRSASILLHLNVRNDNKVTGKNPITSS